MADNPRQRVPAVRPVGGAGRSQRGSLLYDVYVAAQAVGELLRQGMDEAPLTPQEYAVYSFLLEHGEATPSELAHGLSMPAQTVSDWVALLRGRGHVTTVRNPADGRSYLVALTADGRDAHAATAEPFGRSNEAFLAALRRPEGELRESLAEVIRAAESAQEAQPPSRPRAKPASRSAAE